MPTQWHAATQRVPGLDGAATRFSTHRAPVTVVALWATYCAPCLRELSLIEALHARMTAT